MSLSITNYDHGIYRINNLIDAELCNNMVDMFNLLPLRSTIYGDGNNVECNRCCIHEILDDPLTKKYEPDISLFLSGYVRIIPYIINKINENIFDNKIPSISPVELRIIHGATRQHTDGIAPESPRLLSCIIALNDDFDDGILYFPTQNIKITMKKGDIILFPPYWTHPHHVTKPTNNRYTFTFWYTVNHHSNTHIHIS